MSTNKVFNVRVVGVTFSGRQSVVAKLRPDEPITLRREPTNPYDANAIMVVRQTGEQIGYIDRYLAASISPQLDESEHMVTGKVLRVSGNSYPSGSLGVQIQFSLPIQEHATAEANQ